MSERIIHTTKIDGGDRLSTDDKPNLRFPWWSFTKTALSACALQLVAQDRLKLNDPLPGNPYTLRQLLQHTAGVPNYGPLASYHDAVARGDEPWTVDELLERVGADQLDFAPGQGWAYSNVGYLFVRQLIEETSGSDLATVLRKLVFDPLDLRSIALATKPTDLDGTAWGNQDRYHPGWVFHGLLIGTAMDAACLLDGLMSGRLLPPDLLDIMKSRHPLGGPIPGRPWETTGYGLGLMTGQMSIAGPAIGHSGIGPGSVSAVYHFPERNPSCTVAAFAQGDDEGVNEHEVVRLATQ